MDFAIGAAVNEGVDQSLQGLAADADIRVHRGKDGGFQSDQPASFGRHGDQARRRRLAAEHVPEGGGESRPEPGVPPPLAGRDEARQPENILLREAPGPKTGPEQETRFPEPGRKRAAGGGENDDRIAVEKRTDSLRHRGTPFVPANRRIPGMTWRRAAPARLPSSIRGSRVLLRSTIGPPKNRGGFPSCHALCRRNSGRSRGAGASHMREAEGRWSLQDAKTGNSSSRRRIMP
jgi:hypothetical protein